MSTSTHSHVDGDHDHTTAGPDAPTLPDKPDLKQLATRAKELRRGVQGGNPAALATMQAHHPRGGELVTTEGRSRVTLRDAQLALARSLGFEGWNALSQSAGRARVEERDMHRWFGVELNNEVWDLIGSISPDSPEADRVHLLYTAYASTRHWLEVGTTAHEARGEYMIARAALAIGRPELGLEHAQRCVRLVQEHPDVMADWDAPFAHEVLARALAAAGNTTAAREHLTTSVELAAAVADPQDREVLDAERAAQPWFGLV